MQSVATMFCISWIVCNLMRVYFYVDSSSLIVYTWIDGVQGALAGLICFTRPTWWSRAVTLSLYAQMASHLVFWYLKAVLGVHVSSRGYVLVINVLYAAQLLSLTIAGGLVVASRWWRWHIHPAIKRLTSDHWAPI
ncbi:hypothetical protein HOU03_gp412 [Caulobacter phage CcrSC]|uniref:Uncharacterized protein n=1 Tax=Caulobacter phage CcrSC TaxID=2283272 RepID=A0A385EDV4_9CAUD|nr:hypothetical protein HOU03_gp412 [Caulobacter phage CcrSC]AXQ69856.1 hypothetical protein CcrSC_gp274c [Caulobacter phage CcrSC]